MHDYRCDDARIVVTNVYRPLLDPFRPGVPVDDEP
jgi:hypothetical protein